MWHNIFMAVALFFVMEGILPFVRPDRWRSFALVLTHQSDRFLRIMGLISMLIGILFVCLARFSA